MLRVIINCDPRCINVLYGAYYLLPVFLISLFQMKPVHYSVVIFIHLSVAAVLLLLHNAILAQVVALVTGGGAQGIKDSFHFGAIYGGLVTLNLFSAIVHFSSFLKSERSCLSSRVGR